MLQDVFIRPARLDEQTMLESLQRRASLSNPGDRDALLANPDAIALPIEQIAEGCVFVAERDGVVAGFAAVLPRPDGGAELDALFVEPRLWKQGVGRALVEHVAEVARLRHAWLTARRSPARAASILAMSIFFIVIIASIARLAAAVSGSVIASINTRGAICQLNPNLSLHQPHMLSWPPLPTIAFQ